MVETVRYFYEPGSLRPMAQEVNGAVQLIMCDHLGTPTELFSEAGELLWSRKGRLWGADYGVARLKAANDNGAYVDCLIRFQGQFFDAETGLHYNRHRYYDPYSGEYLSPDPIGLAGGLRSYGYVADPTAWIDPLGLAGCEGSKPSSSVVPSRPPDSPFYSVATEVQLPSNAYPGLSRQRHNQIANQMLHERFKADPKFASQMENLYPGIVDGVKPGPRGAHSRSAPTPDLTWHHGQEPGQLQLVPIDQHTAPGPVQQSLHPGGKGGYAEWGK